MDAETLLFMHVKELSAQWLLPVTWALEHPCLEREVAYCQDCPMLWEAVHSPKSTVGPRRPCPWQSTTVLYHLSCL